MYSIGQQVAFVLERISDKVRGLGRRGRHRIRYSRGLSKIAGVYIGVPMLCALCAGVLSVVLDTGVLDGADGPARLAQDRKTPARSAPVAGEDSPWRNEKALPPVIHQTFSIPDIDVLGEEDERRYRQIFTLQQNGAGSRADALVNRLKDRSLMGHVLADRFLREDRPDYEAVAKWLGQHRDHPDATRLYDLAGAVKPKRARPLEKATVDPESLRGDPPPAPPHWSTKNNTKKQRRRARQLMRSMRVALADGKVDKAEKILRRREVKTLFDQYELDGARSKLAIALYHRGKTRKAYKFATMAIARSGRDHPIAYWTAGLSAWRQGMMKQAARHFSTLAQHGQISDWTKAGAALWAARAYQRVGKSAERKRWLIAAAKHPATIYGLIATTTLGAEPVFASLAPPPSPEVLAPLLKSAHGRRALALIQIGQTTRAEYELLGLREWRNDDVRNALFALAGHSGMPSLGAMLAKRLPEADLSRPARGRIEAAYFPIPAWRVDPRSRIDRALLFALMRQESSFFALAKSPAGAKGLMQIMPQTAKDLSSYNRFRKMKTLDRYDPTTSIALGQTYLQQIMRQRGIGNDLIRVIASYNAGLGNVRHWQRRMDVRDDPLLFIESLPNLETRLFVRRVLTNFWIYRARLGQAVPSLDQMAKGVFPAYHRLDPDDPPQIGEVPQIGAMPDDGARSSARNGPSPAG